MNWEIRIKTEDATVICNYNPTPVVQRIIKNLRRILNINKIDHPSFEEMAREQVERALRRHIYLALKDALSERSEIESQKIMLRKLSADDGYNLNPETVSRWIEQEARRARIEARRRMGARMRGGSEPQYSLVNLKKYYYELLPQWQGAKRIYRQNRSLDAWLGMILAPYPNLPVDLIDNLRLIGIKPSELAAEHAARLCGAPDNFYSVRWLMGRIRESR